MSTRESELADFARCILDQREDKRLAYISARPGADPHARINIYRNNTYSSLTAVLSAVFPVTERLVGEGYFGFIANRFITSLPPSEPRLSQFGGAFPGFLRKLEELTSIPFVAETARLEWMIGTVLDQPVLTPIPLSSLDWFERPERAVLCLQQSLRLMISRWPVMSIWIEHQRDGIRETELVSTKSAERIILWRYGESIRLSRLDAARHRFIKELINGATLEKAAGRAMERDRLFDLATALAQLFGDGLVAGVFRSPN